MAEALTLNASEFVKLAKQGKANLFPTIIADREVYVETYDRAILVNGGMVFQTLPTRREKIPFNPEDPAQIGKHTIDWLADQTKRDFYAYLDQVKNPTVLSIRLSVDVWPVLLDKILEEYTPRSPTDPVLNADFTPQAWQKFPIRLREMLYADKIGGKLNSKTQVLLQASFPPGLSFVKEQKDHPDVILTATGPLVKSIAATVFDTMVEVMARHAEMVKKEYMEYNAAVRNVLDVIFTLK